MVWKEKEAIHVRVSLSKTSPLTRREDKSILTMIIELIEEGVKLRQESLK